MAKRAPNGAGSAKYIQSKKLWRYRYTVKDPDGLSFPDETYGKTQKEAMTKGKTKKTKLEQGFKKDGRTFKEFSEEWYQRQQRAKKADNTLVRYKRELGYANEVLGKLKLQQIKGAHIQKVLDNLMEREIAASSQRKVLERLRVIFRQARREGIIQADPAEFIEVVAPSTKTERRALEPGEIALLLTELERHPMGLLLRLLVNTGMRKGEALALQWQSLDLKRGTIAITQSWNGKKLGPTKTPKAKRVIQLPPPLAEQFRARHQELLEHWTATELKGSFVFGTVGQEKPFEVNSPNHALTRILKRLGLPHMRVHDLRHTFVTHALGSGNPPEVVTEWIGHEDYRTTLEIYRHITNAERSRYSFSLEDTLPKPVRAEA